MENGNAGGSVSRSPSTGPGSPAAETCLGVGALPSSSRRAGPASSSRARNSARARAPCTPKSSPMPRRPYHAVEIAPPTRRACRTAAPRSPRARAWWWASSSRCAEEMKGPARGLTPARIRVATGRWSWKRATRRRPGLQWDDADLPWRRLCDATAGRATWPRWSATPTPPRCAVRRITAVQDIGRAITEPARDRSKAGRCRDSDTRSSSGSSCGTAGWRTRGWPTTRSRPRSTRRPSTSSCWSTLRSMARSGPRAWRELPIDGVAPAIVNAIRASGAGSARHPGHARATAVEAHVRITAERGSGWASGAPDDAPSGRVCARSADSRGRRKDAERASAAPARSWWTTFR